jgi:hypothetical protein
VVALHLWQQQQQHTAQAIRINVQQWLWLVLAISHHTLPHTHSSFRPEALAIAGPSVQHLLTVLLHP